MMNGAKSPQIQGEWRGSESDVILFREKEGIDHFVHPHFLIETHL